MALNKDFINIILEIIPPQILWFFLMIPMVSLSQEVAQISTSENWRSVDANASRAEFKSLEKLLSESYQWETKEQIDYLSKMYEAGIAFENDTLIFFYGEKLGVLYRELDSISLALTILNTSLKHGYDASSKRIAYNSLGGLHLKSRDYNAALDYYFKSLEEAKKLNDGSEAYPIGNISEIYSILRDYENSIKYLKYSIYYSSSLKSPEKEYSLVYDYGYLIESYQNVNEVDSTKKYVALTLEKIELIDTLKKQKYQDARFIGYYAVANFYIKSGISDKAEYYIAKTEESAQSFYMSSVYTLKARLAMLNREYSKAIQILENEMLNEEEYSGKEELFALKAKCYNELGDLQQVIALKEEIINFQKEKFGSDRVKFTAFANAKYETLQKTKEINALRLDKQVNSLTIQNQKYVVIITLILLLFIVAAAIAFWQQYQDRKKLSMSLQNQVASKTKDLQQANEEVRILSYIASHDIKEPIRNIGNFVTLIKLEIPKEIASKLSYYFETITNSSNQLYTLVEDVSKYISMSKDEKVEKSFVNLDQLINNISFALNKDINEKNGVLINNGLPKLYTSSTLIYVMLKHLIENGLKFNNSDTPIVEISHESTPTHDHIMVSDNGIGIEEKYQERIFEGFKRLHERKLFNGSGIGLTIVKLLADKMEAKIIVESKKGEGSKFIICLPKETSSLKAEERLPILNRISRN